MEQGLTQIDGRIKGNDMSLQEKALWMLPLVQHVAEGGELESLACGQWYKADHLPLLSDPPYSWRIKPQLKVVDMTPFIENGLDCEFSNSVRLLRKVALLRGIDEGGRYCADSLEEGYKYCRPRLNHPFIWTPGIELPEGLVVEYGYFDGHEFCWEPNKCDDTCVARIIGIKEGYVFPGEEQ